MSWLKKRLPKKRWKRICIYLFSIFLILIAADMLLVQYWRRIDISLETTRITTPLTPEGFPDYIAYRNALDSQGVTPENNAAPELLQIIGTDWAPESWRDQALPQLGTRSLIFRPLITNYDAWLVKNDSPDSPEADYSNPNAQNIYEIPWKSTDYPKRVRWLNEQREGLSKLHLALQKDRFYIPWTAGGPPLVGSTIRMLLPWLGKSRMCSSALMADAMRAAGDGDVVSFQNDITDSIKLARLIGQGPLLIEYMVSVAMETNAWRGVQAVALTPQFLTADQARSLLNALNAEPPFPDLSKTMDIGERYLVLDAFCYAAAFGFDHYRQQAAMSGEQPPLNPLERLLIPCNFNASLKTNNNFFDQLLAIYKLPTHKQRLAAQAALSHQLQSLYNRWSLADNLVFLRLPTLEIILNQYQTAITNRTLAQLTLALSIYHSQHNTYPANLDLLTPSILPTLTRDDFADTPFRYYPTPTGYLLYSVGPDGIDNGGIDRNHHLQNRQYDLVVKTPN